MAIRRQRAPRAGEILAWVSGKRHLSYKPEEGKSGPQLRISPCPCCSNAKRGGSLVINTGTGLWKCFSRGTKGNWYGLTKLAGYPISDPYEDQKPVDFKIFDQVRSRLRRPVTGSHHPELLDYCHSRRLLPATLDAWRVSSKGPKALRFPLFALDENGRWQIANARIRQVIDREKANPADWFEVRGGPTTLALGNHLLGIDPIPEREKRPFWLREWLDPTLDTPEERERTGSPFPHVRRVLIVEGQWDAMTAYQLGIPNVISMANGASAVDVSGLLRYVPDDAEIWLGVDMDEAGDRCAEIFFAQLGSKLKRLQLPFKDLNEWLMERPTLTADDVLATIGEDQSREEMGTFQSLDSLVVGNDAPTEIICEAPWPRLTRRLSGGFRAGQTSGLLAPSGTGKTTLANNIVAHAAKLGVRVGVIQLEGTQKECVTKLQEQVISWAGCEFPEQSQAILANVILSGLRGKKVTWQQTIAETKAMLMKGCRMIIIDNWDYIVPGDKSGATIKAKAYAQFQELMKEFDAHGQVVWQPVKVDREEKINSGSQKGLATAFQDADVYMTLNKFGLARRLEVEKARVDEEDEASSVIWLRYDREKKSMFETDGQADLKPLGASLPPEEF